MHPEAKARQIIDKKLAASGWLLQDYKGEFNPAASSGTAQGVAVREFSTSSGPVDYMLFVDKGYYIPFVSSLARSYPYKYGYDLAPFVNKKPVGVVEAKKSDDGQNITVAETQNLRYANSSPKWQIPGHRIRFVYEATDILTRFTDYADEHERSREVFSFHRPSTLLALLKDDATLRNRLKRFPPFDDRGFRGCQTKAIINLEESFAANKPRALIQMATGAGKTFTAITSVYRLLKYARAKRILFLVDTKNLGSQAEQELRGYIPNDDPRLFP